MVGYLPNAKDLKGEQKAFNILDVFLFKNGCLLIYDFQFGNMIKSTYTFLDFIAKAAILSKRFSLSLKLFTNL